MAMNTNTPTTASPRRPRQVPSRSSRTVSAWSPNSGWARSSTAAPACSPAISAGSARGRGRHGSSRLHPRVEVEVQAVGEEVGDDHAGREDEEGALEHGEVLVVDGLEAQEAQARPREDR